LPSVRTVLIPVGGGGLSGGSATAIQALAPKARVFGVQAEGADPLPRSFESGQAEQSGPPRTFADGMAATRVFDYMWPLLRERLAGAMRVSDAELQKAIVHLAKECHVVAEGAGAAGLAAAWKHRGELEEPVVAVVSGGNLDPALLVRFLQG
jgi:threonine dehydratase